MVDPQHSAPGETDEQHTDVEHPELGRVFGDADSRYPPGLSSDFDGIFGTETIEQFLHSSFDQFAEHATVTKFLPLMAERFARQRLRALAKGEGLRDDGKPTVLSLCVHNAGRSQMAMGFFTDLAGYRAVAWSGGSEPGMEVNPAAIAAMAERGIDISGEYPKPWTDETVRAADVVITMGCGDACPIFPGKRYEEWVLDDPAALNVDEVRPVGMRSNAESASCWLLNCRSSPETERSSVAILASRPWEVELMNVTRPRRVAWSAGHAAPAPESRPCGR